MDDSSAMAMFDSLQKLIHKRPKITQELLFGPYHRVVYFLAVDGLEYHIDELLIDEVFMQFYDIWMI